MVQMEGANWLLTKFGCASDNHVGYVIDGDHIQTEISNVHVLYNTQHHGPDKYLTGRQGLRVASHRVFICVNDNSRAQNNNFFFASSLTQNALCQPLRERVSIWVITEDYLLLCLSLLRCQFNNVSDYVLGVDISIKLI